MKFETVQPTYNCWSKQTLFSKEEEFLLNSQFRKFCPVKLNSTNHSPRDKNALISLKTTLIEQRMGTSITLSRRTQTAREVLAVKCKSFSQLLIKVFVIFSMASPTAASVSRQGDSPLDWENVTRLLTPLIGEYTVSSQVERPTRSNSEQFSFCGLTIRNNSLGEFYGAAYLGDRLFRFSFYSAGLQVQEQSSHHSVGLLKNVMTVNAAEVTQFPQQSVTLTLSWLTKKESDFLKPIHDDRENSLITMRISDLSAAASSCAVQRSPYSF